MLPGVLAACTRDGTRVGRAESPDPDLERLVAWVAAVRSAGLAGADIALGRSAVRVGELAAGTPYEAATLEAYLRAGGSPAAREPLTLSLTRLDCVTLVEACLAVARVAGDAGPPTWEIFGRAIERMR